MTAARLRMAFHAAVLFVTDDSLLTTTSRAASFAVRQIPDTAKTISSAMAAAHAGQKEAIP